MLHIALCDDNPASIEILEKYFDILNDSTIDYDVYFSANYAQTECQFRYCGTAIPFLTVRSTAR